MEQPSSSSSIPNEFISSVICNNEDEKLHELNLHYIFIADEESQTSIRTDTSSKDDTHEIHIVEKRKNPTKVSNEQAIIDKVNDTIERLCNVRNIIIYVLLSNSSDKDNKFIELFNNFLRKTLPDKYYSNIVIFNFFDDKKFNSNDPKYINYSKHNKHCLSNVNKTIDSGKKFFRVSNVFCGKKLKFLFIQPDGNLKYVYNFIHSAELYDYEHLKSFIIERRCSTGKLIQFTGTCWINGILNALLLPKSSRKYMIEQCYKNIKAGDKKNKTELYDIYDTRDELTYSNILSSIIYHIFIKKELPSSFKSLTSSKNDFILSFADKMKRSYVEKNYTEAQIQMLKSEKKEESKYYNTNDVRFGIGGNAGCCILSVKEILSNYLKDFQYTYRMFVTEFPVKYTIDELAKIKKPTLEKRIKKGSSYYQLSSSILLQNEGRHVICGFICEGKEYLYNSNIKRAIECNWSSYDFQGYIDYHIEHYSETYPIFLKDIKTLYIESLIYTLETPEDIKDNETAIEEVEEEAKTMLVPEVTCNIKPVSSKKSITPPTTSNKTKKCRSNQELINGKCLVKCKNDQIRNPETGRCKKNAKTLKCRPNQEIINGKCLVKCKKDQMRNPETGRCKKSINFLPF
jgi:hypothetical protein